MAGLILGYAQKGGLADIEAAKPEAGAAARRRRGGRRRASPARSRSISATMATPARAQADLVLPGAAYAEKHGTYVNTRGPGAARRARDLPAGRGARGLGDLPRACPNSLGKPLPFDSFDQLRAAMVAEYPELGRDGLIDLPWAPPKLDAKADGPGRAIRSRDFYLTNAICRASPTMQRCSEELVHGAAPFAEAAE